MAGSPCRPLPARDPLGGHVTRGRRACSGSPWLGPAPAFEGHGSVEGYRPPRTASPARPGRRSGLGGGRARGRVRRARDCGACSPRSPAFPMFQEDGGASGHVERERRRPARRQGVPVRVARALSGQIRPCPLLLLIRLFIRIEEDGQVFVLCGGSLGFFRFCTARLI